MKVEKLDTPAAIVDLDIMEANINRAQRYLSTHGINNRCHIKTHKIPAIAQVQIEAGAVGITCCMVTNIFAELAGGGTGIYPLTLPGKFDSIARHDTGMIRGLMVEGRPS